MTTITTLEEIQQLDDGTEVTVAVPERLGLTPRRWTLREGRLVHDGAAVDLEHFRAAVTEGLVTTTVTTTGQVRAARTWARGDRVRLTQRYMLNQHHDRQFDAIASVGNVGTITEVEPSGQIVSVDWDHNRGDIRRVDISVLGLESERPFASGDRVTMVGERYTYGTSHHPRWHETIARPGDVGTIDGPRGDSAFMVRWDRTGVRDAINTDCLAHFEEAVEQEAEPYVPQIGDRVRMVAPRYTYNGEQRDHWDEDLARTGDVGVVEHVETRNRVGVLWDRTGSTAGRAYIDLACVAPEGDATTQTQATNPDVEQLRNQLAAITQALGQLIGNMDDADDADRIRAMMTDQGLEIPAVQVEFNLDISGSTTIDMREHFDDVANVRGLVGPGVEPNDWQGTTTIQWSMNLVHTAPYSGSGGDACEDRNHINEDWVRSVLVERGITFDHDTITITGRECEQCM
jgi:hypothetical protein